MHTLIAVATFITIVLFIEGVYAAQRTLAETRKERLRRRMHTQPLQETTLAAVPITRRVILSDIPWLNAILVHIPALRTLGRLLDQANQPFSLGTFCLSSLILFLVGLLLSPMLSRSLAMQALFALAAGSLPLAYVFRRKRVRLRQFEQQLPEALDLVARALKAGHTLMVGLKMVGEEMPEPIGTEFRLTVDEISYGADVHEALAHLTTRVACPDLHFFVTAILLQRETGGNLAEILDKTSRLIRQRFELQGRVRVLAAEGKFSAIVLVLLPFVVSLALYLLNPDYFTILFTDPLGKIFIMSALMLMGLGILAIKNMITIKV
jgi:tight adherence protein B